MWHYVNMKIPSGTTMRGKRRGVAGKEKLVGVPNFHSWGNRMMPLTNMDVHHFLWPVNQLIYIMYDRSWNFRFKKFSLIFSASVHWWKLDITKKTGTTNMWAELSKMETFRKKPHSQSLPAKEEERAGTFYHVCDAKSWPKVDVDAR